MQDQTMAPANGVNVPVGKTSLVGGGLSVSAFVAALVAFISGARDTQTIELLATGVVLVAITAGGRYAQAVAQVLAAALNKGGASE